MAAQLNAALADQLARNAGDADAMLEILADGVEQRVAEEVAAIAAGVADADRERYRDAIGLFQRQVHPTGGGDYPYKDPLDHDRFFKDGPDFHPPFYPVMLKKVTQHLYFNQLNPADRAKILSSYTARGWFRRLVAVAAVFFLWGVIFKGMYDEGLFYASGCTQEIIGTYANMTGVYPSEVMEQVRRHPGMTNPVVGLYYVVTVWPLFVLTVSVYWSFSILAYIHFDPHLKQILLTMLLERHQKWIRLALWHGIFGVAPSWNVGWFALGTWCVLRWMSQSSVKVDEFSIVMTYEPGPPMRQAADVRPQHHRTSELDADSWVSNVTRTAIIYTKRFSQDEEIRPGGTNAGHYSFRINLSPIQVSTTLTASVYQQLTVAADNKPLIRNILASLFYSTNINVPAISHVHYGTRAYLLAAACTPKSETHFFNERSYEDVVTRA